MLKIVYQMPVCKSLYLSLCCLVVWWNGEYSERRLMSDSLCAGNAMALIIEPRCDVDAVLEASSVEQKQK